MARPRVSIEERFLRYIEILSDEECWLWRGHQPQQYGRLHLGGRQSKVIGAHVFAYRWHYGSIPDGLCVLHHCDTPACCNPLHLFVGTKGDNIRDAAAKGRAGQRGDDHWERRDPEKARRAHEKRRQNHPESWQRGEERPAAKLTEAGVREMRRRHEHEGASIAGLAREYGVNEKTASMAVTRKSWKHVS
jgi:hypothetical protein